MYKRLIIVSAIIFLGLYGLSLLGFHSISLHTEGLAGRRSAEFTGVAEQIRRDVARSFDQFLQVEHNRPYTHYQYIYVPQTGSGRVLLRSPLADGPEHGLAYGYFQIDPQGKVSTPYYAAGQTEQVDENTHAYVDMIKEHLVKQLNFSKTYAGVYIPRGLSLYTSMSPWISSSNAVLDDGNAHIYEPNLPVGESSKMAQSDQNSDPTHGRYRIESLDQNRRPRLLAQDRINVEDNLVGNLLSGSESTNLNPSRVDASDVSQTNGLDVPTVLPDYEDGKVISVDQLEDWDSISLSVENFAADPETVQVRIEPFVPVIVPAMEMAPFGGHVFLLRHVQIENKHFVQGFKLDQESLIQMVRDSADRLVRKGMGYKIGQVDAAAHTAVLDFGFGEMVLSLIELEPGWITRHIDTFRRWYIIMISFVVGATLLALGSLWRNMHGQIKLAQKKDNFISAVSHELRTPLTTLRMYTEMLEKGWIKDDNKRTEYYVSMRQENERLSRLIENVLDFSRIQRGRKNYEFSQGDINQTVGSVVDMMQPYARKAGFSIEKDLEKMPPMSYDSDAVMQIVINLIDNAVKYASQAEDKRIIVRTRLNDHILIEVEDHGPGIPRLQRKKVFDEFYRCGDESRREAAGTGLGLALVKRFAEAHAGFVEILSARPHGTVLRVALSANPKVMS